MEMTVEMKKEEILKRVKQLAKDIEEDKFQGIIIHSSESESWCGWRSCLKEDVIIASDLLMTSLKSVPDEVMRNSILLEVYNHWLNYFSEVYGINQRSDENPLLV